MKTKYPRSIWILSLGLLLLLALNGGNAARAQPPAPAEAEAISDESWRYGITVEGPLTYTDLDGRLLAEVAAFRSAREANIYFAFPAPATAKTVTAARYYIVSRSGSYTGDALLSLRVYNFSGVLQRTVTSADVDLETAPVGSWQSLSLTAGQSIAPGEFLVFRFHLNATPGGNLDVRPIFEVIVE